MQKLQTALASRKNNFDLVRLVAAALVIYGHSFAFVPGGQDILHRVFGFWSADIAVKSFFFLSGLLVCNSLIERPSIRHYAVARFARIMPALLFMLVLVAFVMGPAVSTLAPGAYFSDAGTYRFLRGMGTLQAWGTQSLGYFNLPGAFPKGLEGGSINAPLWTLSVEVFAYGLILALFALGLLNRRIAPWIALAILADSMLEKPVLFFWLDFHNPDFRLMPFCFAVGGLCAVFKDRITPSIHAPLGLWLAFYLFQGSPAVPYLFYGALFATILWFACLPSVVRLRLPGDVSYGLYLWGWPVQQLLLFLWPAIGWGAHLTGALVLAGALAVLSWAVVERPAIGLGRRFA